MRSCIPRKPICYELIFIALIFIPGITVLLQLRRCLTQNNIVKDSYQNVNMAA